MGFVDDAKKKVEDAVGNLGGQDGVTNGSAGSDRSRPTGPTGPDDPTQPTESTEPAAPTGPMGSGVPGGGADRSDDPITKPEGSDDGDSDPVPTDPSPVPPAPGADPNEHPRRMHNMRGLDDETGSDA